MKAILFFVANGIPRDSDRTAADTINRTTGKRVVFRNADQAEGRPEANEGVAGKVPENYQEFKTYTADAGGKVDTKAATGNLAAAAATGRTLNAFGVPDEDGAPTDRESLKEILTAEGIEFHARAGDDKLIALYMAHFYPDDTKDAE